MNKWQREREKRHQLAGIKKDLRCLYALLLNARHLGVDFTEIETKMTDLKSQLESLSPSEDIWPCNRTGNIEARTEWVWSYISESYVKDHGGLPERRDGGTPTWAHNRAVAPFSWVANGLVVDKEDFAILKKLYEES